jgi:hypothetical protein
MEQKEYFTGQIIDQKKKKVYHKNSEFHGNTYYRLTIANYSQKHTFFAYANLLKEEL